MTHLVITQGDPAGIGPELVLRVAHAGLLEPGDRVVAGRETLRQLARELAGRGCGWAEPAWDRVAPLLDPMVQALDRPGCGPGRPGQFAALERGVDLVLGDPAAALVTAPIDKAVAVTEGLTHPGHTEYLAERAQVEDFAMLMAGEAIRVALATIHLPLRRVAEVLDREAVVRAGSLLARALVEDYGIASPIVGVLGLNPHAGERGLLGDEEQTIVAPALERLRAWARARGLAVEFRGPMPADTAFHYNRVGDLDGVVAMYHDQGLGPFKLAHFDDGVNVTLGLPFVRTSPDHGTAKDIAGRGVARDASMRAAIELARSMARGRASRATSVASNP